MDRVRAESSPFTAARPDSPGQQAGPARHGPAQHDPVQHGPVRQGPARRHHAAWLIVVAGSVAAVVVGVGAVWIRGPANFTVAGFTYPGRFTDAAAAGLRVVAEMSGAVTVGALLFAAVCTAPRAGGGIGPDGYAALSIARRAAPVWVISALLLTPVIAADVVGQPVSSLLQDGEIWSVIGQTLPSRGWLTAGLLAIPVVFATRWVLSFTGVVGLAVWGCLCLLPPGVVGNAGEGLGHDVDTTAVIVHVLAGSVWTGAAIAAAMQLGRRRVDDELLARRFAALSLGCAGLLAITGIALGANLVGPGEWLTTQYGHLALAKTAGFAALVAGGWWLARRLRTWLAAGRRRQARLVTAWQSALLLAALGASVGMAQQPASGFLVTNPNPSQQQIGYSLLRPPSLATLASMWRFDLLLGTAAVVAAAWYLLQLARLHRAGLRWSPARTASFLSGCAGLLVTSSSGITAYAEATLTWHMIAHMSLDMIVPALLVAGGPLTLLTTGRAPAPAGAPPGVREQVGWLLHSWPVKLLTNPFGALALYAVLLFGLYLTPIFGYAIGYHWGHEAMDVAFLLLGYAVFWQMIGVDPLPRPVPYLARLGLLAALMSIDAVFGVAILTRQTVMGWLFYGYLHLPWLTDRMADQHLGGLIAWIGGEVPLLIVAVLVLLRWWRDDDNATGATGGRADGTGIADPVRALRDELRRQRAADG